MENPDYQQLAAQPAVITSTSYGGNHQTIVDLFNGAYNVIVNYTLNNDVSNEAKADLEFLENKLEQLAAVTDLRIPQDVLLMIRDQIHSFLTKHQRQFAPTEVNNHYGISPQQDAFTQRITAVIIAIQTYLRLGNDIPTIKKLHTSLLRLEVLNANAPSLTETFGLDDVKTDDDFMKKITRKSTVNFDDLYGIPHVVKTIKDTLENIRFTQNEFIFLILSGPPGTGKSSIAKAMATEFSNNIYYNLGIGELSSPTIGATEKGLREAFGKFEKSTDKVTIIFDEMDNIFSKVIKQAAHINSVKVTLQTEISGGRDLKNNVLMVGLTNYYNTLEDVIKRRATKVVYVPIPSLHDTYLFLIGLLKIPADNLQESFKTSLLELLRNNPNNNYTNANMKHIHTNAIASFIGRFDRFNAALLSNNTDLLLQSNSLKIAQMNYVLTLKRDLPDQINYIIVPEITDYRASLMSIAIMSDIELNRYRIGNDPEHLVDISPDGITTIINNNNIDNNNIDNNISSTTYRGGPSSASSESINQYEDMIVEKKNRIKQPEQPSSSTDKSSVWPPKPPIQPPPPQFKIPTTASSKRTKKLPPIFNNNYSSDESEKEKSIPRKIAKQKSIQNVDADNELWSPDEGTIARKTSKTETNNRASASAALLTPLPFDDSFELEPSYATADSTTNFDMAMSPTGNTPPIIEMPPDEDQDMSS